MITVKFYMSESRITGFECRGHSGFGCRGSDIVCAAVTSAVRLVECTVNDVLGLGAAVGIDNENASVSLRLPEKLSPGAENTCQTVLTALMVYLTGLKEEYPENIDVLEV